MAPRRQLVRQLRLKRCVARAVGQHAGVVNVVTRHGEIVAEVPLPVRMPCTALDWDANGEVRGRRTRAPCPGPRRGGLSLSAAVPRRASRSAAAPPGARCVQILSNARR
jgi:hypothetical protein